MNQDRQYTQTFASSALDDSCYLRRFQTCNRLSVLHSFIFIKGMHFSDPYQWWNTKKRQCRHEGLDIATFLDYSASVQSFPENAFVPVFLPGIAVHTHEDFLGHTLYVRHDQIRQQSKVLYSLYAHVDTAVTPGEAMPAETIIARLSSIVPSKTISPHLHFSIAWVEENLKFENISWENIADHSAIELIDPIHFITKNPADIQKCM